MVTIVKNAKKFINYDRDTQKRRVYRWTWTYLVGPHKGIRNPVLSQKQCKKFSQEILRNYKSNIHIVLTFEEKIKNQEILGNCKCYHNNYFHIALTKKGQRKTTVLHEIAHALTPGARHGPKFVALYMKLLVKYMDYDLEYLKETADEFRVRYK